MAEEGVAETGNGEGKMWKSPVSTYTSRSMPPREVYGRGTSDIGGAENVYVRRDHSARLYMRKFSGLSPETRVAVTHVPEKKARVLFMLRQPVYDKVTVCMKLAIYFMYEPYRVLMLADMYKPLAVRYYSHNSGCSLRNPIDTRWRLCCHTLPVSYGRHIVIHLLPLTTTLRREHTCYDATWISQLDFTVA